MNNKKSDPESPPATEKEYASPPSSGRDSMHKDEATINVQAKLKNPLVGMSKEDLLADVEAFAQEKELMHSIEDLRRGAILAQYPKEFETMEELREEDKVVLREEMTNRWKQPFMMYFMTVLCAGSAIVQGMDQSSVNGAQTFYFEEFNIGPDQVWLRGLLNGAPYLCSCLIGCWTTKPLNYYFGRRGCIFISCIISLLTGVWMAVADSWWNLLLARFALGFAVGAKSSTTPVYAAECAPTAIRGALAMQWQTWTAFGIMLGFIVSAAFQDFSTEAIPYLNWRLMLGSTGIPPLIVCVQVYFCPESPRWYMTKNKYNKAFEALLRFRPSRIQAARDVYYIHKALVIEEKQKEGKNMWREFFMVHRNRKAAQSSFFVMFMQQFCGVNVSFGLFINTSLIFGCLAVFRSSRLSKKSKGMILCGGGGGSGCPRRVVPCADKTTNQVIAYYSTEIFLQANFTRENALWVSLGTGVVNWLFAVPAIYTIDTFGRRNLLLTTFPLMGIFLLFTGFAFYIPAETARTACVATGIYLFMVVYSPGEGPVPFTYSAEAFPLYIREYGMAFATATTWGFNFLLSLTWPALVEAFTVQGAFGWYAGWNFFGWVFCYFCLPETKALSLEELDTVFSVRTRDHARHYRDMLPWYWKKYVLRGDVPPKKALYQLE